MPAFGIQGRVNISEAVIGELAPEVAGTLAREFGSALLEPTPQQAELARRRINALVQALAPRHGLQPAQVAAVAQRLASQMLGYGFLEPFLEVASRGQLSEVLVNPDGRVFVQPAGETNFWPVVVDPAGRVQWLRPGREQGPGMNLYRPALIDVTVTLSKLLATVGEQSNEARPIVSVKLPPSTRLPAGARLHVVIPPVSVGRYPSVNCRFYVTQPVDDEQLIKQWRMLSPEMATFLKTVVQQAGTNIESHGRIVVSGPTGTGKTTLLSWLLGQIPSHNRILTTEDPAELYFDQPNRVTLEVQHRGTDGGISMLDLVTSSLRMTPQWLVVGEVRGGEALTLLRAQMSGHNGLSSIHASSASDAVETFTLLVNLFGGSRYERRALKELFTRAVDYVIHVGLDAFGRRRVLTIHEVDKSLKGGNVWLLPRFEYDAAGSTAEEPAWQATPEEA